MKHLNNKRSLTLIDRKQNHHCYVVDGLIIFQTQTIQHCKNLKINSNKPCLHFSHVHIVSNNLRIVFPIWGVLLLRCKRNVCVSFIVLLRVKK